VFWDYQKKIEASKIQMLLLNIWPHKT